jgi:hypothetical protein
MSRRTGFLLIMLLGMGIPLHAQSNNVCSDSAKTEEFVLQRDGKLDVTGKNYEGPICVKVNYNPLHFYVDFSTAVTYTTGPDVSTVFTSGGSNTAGAPKPNAPKNRPAALPAPTPPQSLPQAFYEIEVSYQALHGRLHTLDGKYSQAMEDTKNTITDLTNALNSSDGAAASQRQRVIKDLYETKLQQSLTSGLQVQSSYLPSDRASSSADVSLMDALNYAKDSVEFLAQQFVTGDPTATNRDFECSSSNAPTKNPGWTTWYTKCKPAYDSLEAEVIADISTAQQYTALSDKVTALRKNIAIIKYWDDKFASVGLRRDLTVAKIESVDLNPSMSKSTPEVCLHLFNRNQSSAVSISYSDLTPTLSGSAPTAGKTDPFLTVTCASPFSLSVGANFSLIPSPQFAIIKSSGGSNNTSVNKFGTLSNSDINPMPIVMANVRFLDWHDHLLAAHASFGVSGNFQSQNSGGSSADFLVGGSVSVWRVMFLTLGVQIGTKPTLAGGFHVGDTVPSDVTTVQVSKSYTAGFGFAITFTKP